MPYFTYDTSVIIARGSSVTATRPSSRRPTFSETNCHKKHKNEAVLFVPFVAKVLVIGKDLVGLEAHLSQAFAGLGDHFA